VVKSIKTIGWQCGCSTQKEMANAVSQRSLEKLATSLPRRYVKSRKMPANNLILIFERSKNKDDVRA
jgi:hypothetical protein